MSETAKHFRAPPQSRGSPAPLIQLYTYISPAALHILNTLTSVLTALDGFLRAILPSEVITNILDPVEAFIKAILVEYIAEPYLRLEPDNQAYVFLGLTFVVAVLVGQFAAGVAAGKKDKKGVKKDKIY